MIKRNTTYTTQSEQFQNQIGKWWKEAQYIPLTQIHDHSLFSTGTSLNSGGLKLLSWAQKMKQCGNASAFHMRIKCQLSHLTR